MVKNLQKNFSVVAYASDEPKLYWYTASFFKDFYLKNAIVALGHDWQEYLA